MEEKLKKKLRDKIDSMDYGDVIEFLDIDLDVVIENKIESMSQDEILELL